MKKALIILSCIVVAVLAFATAFLLVYERERGVSEKPVLYLCKFNIPCTVKELSGMLVVVP